MPRRKAPWFVLALLLCSSAGASTTPSVDSSQEARELAHGKAMALFSSHRRATKALKSAARKAQFRAYFESRDDRQRAEALATMEEASLKLHDYFVIGEMCLISRDGHEIFRIVEGRVSSELDHDESGNVFFAPGFALDEGDHLVSPLYRSPDTRGWSLAYVTPIYHGDEAVALLHFEHDLASYTSLLGSDLDASRQYVLAFTKEGSLVFDSRRADRVAVTTEVTLPTRVDGMTLDDLSAAIDRGQPIDGFHASYKSVRGWTVLAFVKAP